MSSILRRGALAAIAALTLGADALDAFLATP